MDDVAHGIAKGLYPAEGGRVDVISRAELVKHAKSIKAALAKR